MTIGIPLLDGAAEQAIIWLNEVQATAHSPDRQHAYRLLRATLHTLRDWVNADQAADLGAQLPILIRGIYYEGWNPSATPRHPHGKANFVASVQADFATDPIRNPDLQIGAVFAVLNRHIAAGHLMQMCDELPKPLRGLWAEPIQS